MSEAINHPSPGKLVTVIAVDQGEPLITYGTVLVSRPNLVAVAAHVEPSALPRYKEAPITVLYGDGDYSLLLRGRVTETVAPDRLVISTPDPPRIGERREFIRADLELGIWVDSLGQETGDDQDARDAVDGLSQESGDYRFRTIPIDLSGSGVRCVYPTNLKKDELVAVAFELSSDDAQPMVVVPARTVRARPAKNADAAQEIALTFVALTDEESDLLNTVVFQARARHLGMSAHHLQED